MNPPASSSSRTALRSLQAVALNQLPQVIGSLLFITLVPRRLGPEVYGQLAFCFALSLLFQSLGELGYQEICARFVPEVRQRAGEAGVQKMFGALFAIKAVTGFGLGLAAALTARALAPWLTPTHAALIGAAVAGRIWSMTAFPLLLGLGQTLKWTVEATWRQIILTALILLVVPQPSLTLALAALALHEFIFAAMGFYWVRPYVRSPRPEAGQPAALDLGLRTSDLLQFGLGFSLANFSLVLLFRLGPILVVQLGGSPTEAGFFDLALGGWLLIYTLFERAAFALVPQLTQMELEGRGAEIKAWAGRFVRYATVAAVLAAGGMWALAGPVAPLLFGAGFGPAAGTIRMMGFALLPIPVSWTAVMLSTVEKRPGRKASAALLGLTLLIGVSIALRGLGAPGVALAFGVALAGYTLGFGRTAGRVLRAGGLRLGTVLGLTILFAPPFFLHWSSFLISFSTWCAAALIYVWLCVPPAERLSLRQWLGQR